MTNTKLLEQCIAESGYKKSFIANKLGVTAYGLSLKINNVHEFKASEISILCNILKIDKVKMMSIFFAN